MDRPDKPTSRISVCSSEEEPQCLHDGKGPKQSTCQPEDTSREWSLAGFKPSVFGADRHPGLAVAALTLCMANPRGSGNTSSSFQAAGQPCL